MDIKTLGKVTHTNWTRPNDTSLMTFFDGQKKRIYHSSQRKDQLPNHLDEPAMLHQEIHDKTLTVTMSTQKGKNDSTLTARQ